MNDGPNVRDLLDAAPAPAPPAPRGAPPASPMIHVGQPTAAELRRQADEAEERERRAAAERQAREEELERQYREYERIATETIKEVYENIAQVVDRLGLGELATRLEQAEGKAMAAGGAVDPELGPSMVRDHLRATRAERYRPFLNLVRSDRPEQEK